jgi:hypothetical protein
MNWSDRRKDVLAVYAIIISMGPTVDIGIRDAFIVDKLDTTEVYVSKKPVKEEERPLEMLPLSEIEEEIPIAQLFPTKGDLKRPLQLTCLLNSMEWTRKKEMTLQVKMKNNKSVPWSIKQYPKYLRQKDLLRCGQLTFLSGIPITT